MKTATLIGDDGKPIRCWEPKPGVYAHADAWTAEEAAAYAETGEYPRRLLELIRRENGTEDLSHAEARDL